MSTEKFQFEDTRHFPEYMNVFETAYRESSPESSINRKIGEARKMFGLGKNYETYEDSIVFHEGMTETEVFLASDSFWWTETKLSFQEKNPGKDPLPSETEAVKIAEEYLRKKGAFHRSMVFSHVSFNEITQIKAADGSSKTWRTMANVHYHFTIDGFPVFGSGAKCCVSITGGARVSEFYFFWREPKSGTKSKIITKKTAMDVFSRLPALSTLKPEYEITVNYMEIGYHSVPPPEYQPYYIPSVLTRYSIRKRGTKSEKTEPRTMLFSALGEDMSDAKKYLTTSKGYPVLPSG
jgi:hypothetical protein